MHDLHLNSPARIREEWMEDVKASKNWPQKACTLADKLRGALRAAKRAASC